MASLPPPSPADELRPAAKAADRATLPAGAAGLRPIDPSPQLGWPGVVLVVLGACCVVLGGLVAAVTGPLDLVNGSWLAAYLVLVCGVAQYAIGRAPALLAAQPTPPGLGWAEVACWNLGNVAVIGGTLAGVPVLVDTGAVLLAAGLVIAWRTVRGTGTSTAPARGLLMMGWAYRSLLLVLLVSLPVGILLAHLRAPS